MKNKIEKVYDYLDYACKSEQNGEKAELLAKKLNLSKRELRAMCKAINSDTEKGIVSTSGKIYLCDTEEECQKAINNTFKQAFTLLKKAWAMEKKLGLQNQFEFKNGNETVKIIYGE